MGVAGETGAVVVSGTRTIGLGESQEQWALSLTGKSPSYFRDKSSYDISWKSSVHSTGSGFSASTAALRGGLLIDLPKARKRDELRLGLVTVGVGMRREPRRLRASLDGRSLDDDVVSRRP